MRLCPSDASDGLPIRPHALDDSWRCLHRELVDKAGNPGDIGGGPGHRWILRGPVLVSRRGRGALRNGGHSHGALPRWFNAPNFDQQSLAAGRRWRNRTGKNPLAVGSGAQSKTSLEPQ